MEKKVSNVWTQESIENFWEWYSKTNPEGYFSKQVGSGIFNLVKKQRNLQGEFLDYGCGPGYLLELFLKTQMNCYGCDAAEFSVNLVNKKFFPTTLWKGAKKIEKCTIPFADEKFDTITCIETIEHLDDMILDNLLKELHRVLKKDGLIVFTTPNNEDLGKNMNYCPFCNSEFHRIQHVRSFSKESLPDLLKKYNFNVIYCSEMNLLYHCTLDNPYLLLRKIKYLLNKYIFDKEYVEPHLVVMVSKSH